MRSFLYSFLILILIYGCVEPFDLKSSSVIEKLVVDGEINDQPGPYKVKLFYSRNVLDSENPDKRKEQGAIVWVEDDHGGKEYLQEVEGEPGTYVTSSLQGVVGKSYRLSFITSNGKQYQSEWQLMEPVGVVHDFYSRFETDIITPSEGEIYDYLDGFKFYVSASSDVTGSGLLRWRWKGIFRIESEPHKNTKFVGRAELPDPLPCSGYIVGSRGLEQVDECTCCTCWGYEYGRNVVVSDNANALANDFNDVLIGQVLITKPRFYDRYYVELEQLSVSENEYNFWRLIGEQQKATGNIFQSNAVRIRGNITGINDDEEVLGFFSVSSVVKRSFTLSRADVPYEIGEMHKAPMDCRNSVINGTTEKPEFW